MRKRFHFKHETSFALFIGQRLLFVELIVEMLLITI